MQCFKFAFTQYINPNYDFLFIEQPFEFNETKFKYVKLLNDLKSLEKLHKSITVLQNKILEANVAETYLGTDTNKTNSKVKCCTATLS